MKEIKWIVGINLAIQLLYWGICLGFFYFQPVEDNVLITYSIVVGLLMVPSHVLVNILFSIVMFATKRKAYLKGFFAASISVLIFGALLWYLGGYFLSKVHFEYFMT